MPCKFNRRDAEKISSAEKCYARFYNNDSLCVPLLLLFSVVKITDNVHHRDAEKISFAKQCYARFYNQMTLSAFLFSSCSLW